MFSKKIIQNLDFKFRESLDQATFESRHHDSWLKHKNKDSILYTSESPETFQGKASHQTNNHIYTPGTWMLECFFSEIYCRQALDSHLQNVNECIDLYNEEFCKM